MYLWCVHLFSYLNFIKHNFDCSRIKAIIWFAGWDMVESRYGGNETNREIPFQPGCRLVRREAPRVLDSRSRGTAGSMRDANLVDFRGEYGIRATRGGIWKCAQGLPKKADRSIKRADCNSTRRTERERSAKDHDYLYHRRARAWRCREINIYQSGELLQFSLAVAVKTQVILMQSFSRFFTDKTLRLFNYFWKVI